MNFSIIDRDSGWVAGSFGSMSDALGFLKDRIEPEDDWALVRFGDVPEDNAVLAVGAVLRRMGAIPEPVKIGSASTVDQVFRQPRYRYLIDDLYQHSVGRTPSAAAPFVNTVNLAAIRAGSVNNLPQLLTNGPEPAPTEQILKLIRLRATPRLGATDLPWDPPNPYFLAKLAASQGA